MTVLLKKFKWSLVRPPEASSPKLGEAPIVLGDFGDTLSSKVAAKD